MNTSTISGSNWLPALRRSSSNAYLGEGHPIGPAARHGIERVGNRKNARLLAGLLAVDMSGAPVAGAVVVGVMRGGYLDHRLQELDLGQDVFDDVNVALHLLVFLVGEARLLPDEIAGHRQLADVMNQSGPPHRLQLGWAEADLFGDQLGEVGDALSVAARVEILGLEGFDEAA